MGFYQDISRYYDAIFPVEQRHLAFLRASFGVPPRRLLDVACGSGGYSVALAEAGFTLTAVDLDAAMVEKASQKAHVAGVAVEMVPCGMLSLAETLKGPFDGIFCIGNSLVHLKNPEEISEALRQMYRLLDPGGVLVLQVINFDRILKHRVTALPTLSEPDLGLTFVRNYDLGGAEGRIRFNTVLTVEKEGLRLENSVPLYPLTRGELGAALAETGYGEAEFFGDFAASPFEDGSLMLVVRAKKPL